VLLAWFGSGVLLVAVTVLPIVVPVVALTVTLMVTGGLRIDADTAQRTGHGVGGGDGRNLAAGSPAGRGADEPALAGKAVVKHHVVSGSRPIIADRDRVGQVLVVRDGCVRGDRDPQIGAGRTTARVWKNPAATAPTPSSRRLHGAVCPEAHTRTGVLRFVWVPSPSLPPLAPQARAVPSACRVTLKRKPTSAAVAPPRNVVQPALVPVAQTRTGVGRSVVVPSPSWPESLWPHARTPPLDSTARLWSSPPATEATPVR